MSLLTDQEDFEDDEENTPLQRSKKKKIDGKEKKGGPSIPQSIPDNNQSANVNAGPIPNLVGAHLINGEWECDNSFQEMFFQNFLYDKENAVYPGALAYEHDVWMHNRCTGTCPTKNRVLFREAPQGMPQSVYEGKNLLFHFVTNSTANKLERFKAWMILSEFYYILMSCSGG